MHKIVFNPAHAQRCKQDQNIKSETKTKTRNSRPRSRPRPLIPDLNNVVIKSTHSYYVVIYHIIILPHCMLITAKTKTLRKRAFVTFDFDTILDLYVGLLIV